MKGLRINPGLVSVWIVLGGLALAIMFASTARRAGGVGDPPVLPPGIDPTKTHAEYADQPWAANRGETPAGVASVGGPIVRGRFTSVQVNVNALGNNIVGDAANEPSIAVDPNDRERMAIGWRQFDTIASNFRQAGVAYSQTEGATWVFNGPLDPGQFRSDPVLASDAQGNFYYSSLSSLATVEVFRSTNGGVTWSAPVPAFGGDKQWMVADDTQSAGSGHLYQIWNVQFSCCGANDFTRSINGGVTFLGPYAVPVPSMKWGTMHVSPDGRLFLAGSTLSQSGHLVARSSNVSQSGQTPVFDFVTGVNLGGLTGGFSASSPNPGGLLGQVWIVVDPSTSGPMAGNVYIAASVDPPGTDPQDMRFVRSVNGGTSFSAPVRINDDLIGGNAWQWFGTMSVAPNGRIDVVWNDTRNSGQARLCELYYSSSTDAGQTWTANEPVTPMFDSHLGWPQQNKLGDYYHMVSDNAGADLAYAATFNGEQDVHYVRLTPDCNGNGVADATDVANESSADCNANLTPDECESTEDCNGNGQLDACDVLVDGAPDCNGNHRPDDCDIADETSDDVNLNGIPDECECASVPSAAQAEPKPIVKNRYLSFIPGNAGRETAIRVTFMAMPPPFASLVGTSRWVGSPTSVSENSGTIDPAGAPGAPFFRAAGLSCSPVYRDWGADGVLHVSDAAIAPSGQYLIEMIERNCSVDVGDNYSEALALASSTWGDTVGTCDAPPCSGPNGTVEGSDIVAILDKFANRTGATSKPRVDLIPGTPDRIIAVDDIVFALSAFTGDDYPFSVPAQCP